MSAPDLPPVPPPEFQIVNVLIGDALWQRRFTAIWAVAVGVAIVCSLPHLYKSIRRGYTRTGVTGIWEDWGASGYREVHGGAETEGRKEVPGKRSTRWRAHGVVATIRSFTMWTPPYVGMDVGQMLLIVAYYIILLVTMTIQADLVDNSDRAGFISLAQFPLLFLLATKNSLLSLALGAGRGWEKLNFLHRWSGRGMFLAAAIHGALWIRNHLEYDLPIIGQQKETSGVAALGVMCVIVLTSLRPVRALAYQFFFITHILGFVSFFVTVRYHTTYAAPWMYPPLAFYGLDLLMRMLRFRVKDATLIPCDEHMTLISIADCDGGWVAGQHVRLRVFFDARVLESHPLTIMSAPPGTTCLSSESGGRILLGARVQGDWTRALNAYARRNSHIPEMNAIGEKDVDADDEKADEKSFDDDVAVDVIDKSQPTWLATQGARVHVMLDGPYGGSSVDLGEYESVLLIAGGSGATFSIGMLDDIVGRVVRLGRRGGERTRRIEFVWCVRSFGCLRWFSPMLAAIARTAAGSSLDVHVSVYVTCLCDPEALPRIPNCDVMIERPTCTQIIRGLLARPVAHSSSKNDTNTDTDLETDPKTEKQTQTQTQTEKSTVASCGGGLGVCAAGPESLIREAKNALARVALARGLSLGKVACHTELYAL